MTNSPTAVVKADTSTEDDQRADQASDVFMIGVDTDGREHYFSRIRDCVTVIDDGDDQTQSLDGRPLKDWMAFVEQELAAGTRPTSTAGAHSRTLRNNSMQRSTRVGLDEPNLAR